MAAERIRQSGLDQEAAALNTRSQDRYKDFDGQREQREAKLADYYKGQEVAEPDASAALPASASNITVKEEAKQRGKATDFTDRTGAALGDLRSFGDLLGTTSRLQGRDATQVGQIGGFKRGSSNVLAYELEAANSKGGGLKTIADIAGGLGKVGISAGLSGSNFLGSPAVSNFTPNAAMPSAFGSSGYSGFGPFLNGTSAASPATGLYRLYG